MRTHSRCLKRTPGSNHQAAQVPLTLAHQFLLCRRLVRSPLQDSLSPCDTPFHRSPAYHSSWIFFGFVIMASKDSDVPASVPSSPSAPGTSATSSARRSCLHCARRMSSLKYDKHSICVACRDSQCSVDVKCSECNSWLLDFVLGYVRHQKSLVSKGKKESSSPSKPVAVTTAAPVAPPSLPASTEDQLRRYVHSFLADFMQS